MKLGTKALLLIGCGMHDLGIYGARLRMIRYYMVWHGGHGNQLLSSAVEASCWKFLRLMEKGVNDGDRGKRAWYWYMGWLWYCLVGSWSRKRGHGFYILFRKNFFISVISF